MNFGQDQGEQVVVSGDFDALILLAGDPHGVGAVDFQAVKGRKGAAFFLGGAAPLDTTADVAGIDDVRADVDLYGSPAFVPRRGGYRRRKGSKKF